LSCATTFAATVVAPDATVDPPRRSADDAAPGAPTAPVDATTAPEPQRLFDPARLESRRSYAIPALEILGFDFLLNRSDHRFEGSE
jgi:hypothetical protein